MESRYRIKGSVGTKHYFAEFPFTEYGLKQAKAARKIFAPFKRRRIRDIIQACPSQVVPYMVYDQDTEKVADHQVPKNPGY